MAEGENVGTFEDGRSWLPSQVLDEARNDYSRGKLRNQWQHRHRQVLKSPGTEPLHSKSSSEPQQRSRYPKNWAAAGGPGMQAIFLDSNQKSCGTGVFLPRRTGTDFQLTSKPGTTSCSPVLLPARVVQALNLNMHEVQLGLQIKSQDHKNNSRESENSNLTGNNKKSSDLLSRGCMIPQSRSASPAIYLPKEWTY